jgi:putative membrane protein
MLTPDPAVEIAPMKPQPPIRGAVGPQLIDRGHDAAVYLAIVLHFVAIVVVTAAAVYVLLHLIRGWGGRKGSGRSAGIDELDVRYARGEIDRTEYVTRRADLLGITYGPPPVGGPPASG